jgi:hypothetical protein
MKLRICASCRASFRTLRSRSSICSSIASRALSSCVTTATSSERSSISSAARAAKPLNFARCAARQQGFDRMTIEIFDADLLEPAGLHDTGDADRIVTIAFIDLHLEHSLGMACINTDHRYAQPLELGPQPRRCRPAFKPNPNSIRRLGSHKCSDRRRSRSRVPVPASTDLLFFLLALGALAGWADSEAVLPAYIIGMVRHDRSRDCIHPYCGRGRRTGFCRFAKPGTCS